MQLMVLGEIIHCKLKVLRFVMRLLDVNKGVNASLMTRKYGIGEAVRLCE